MDEDFDIAIVGMACRFPGADNLEEFWRNLSQGVESISRFSDEELLAQGVPAETLRRADYVKAAPVLADPALFDAAFFGYTPLEAQLMDPQQRLLLELAHAALEDAGCNPRTMKGPTGVFVGSAMNTYFTDRRLGERFAQEYIPTLIGNDKDFLATRISYKLGLKGPSLAVQTACSTSLVAVHLARQSLLSEECDAALAGAVSVRVPHRTGYWYDGSGVVSPDGHVRAFAAGAQGTVFGSGAGVLVLKRLGQARTDGDRIYAVIKGSAINNDGSVKTGYTAPSVDGQAAVVLEALANAGVDAGQISYLEAHGSGTPVGDRIELAALTKAFRRFTSRSGYCAIGSVKTNLGHLDAAAGMAGLIKTALALQRRQLPPSLNFDRPNEEIDFPATPFFVNTSLRDWAAEGGPRRAGVMATGMGGTNAHVVLEEAPAADSLSPSAEDNQAGDNLSPSAQNNLSPSAPKNNLSPSAEAEDNLSPSAGSQLWVLSAKSEAALAAAGRNLADRLAGPDAPLAADVAWTLQAGREAFAHRRFAVCGDTAAGVAALRAPSASESGVVGADGAPEGVLLFTGVGDQYPGMGRGLYQRFAAFRSAIDECAEILAPHLGRDVREVLYPPSERTGSPDERAGDNALHRGGEAKIDLKRMLGGGPASPLDETRWCQPALFAVEYALARLWMDWGIQPSRMVGHSMGEYVAACVAGVFTLPDALRLIAWRARRVNELPPARMLAVLLPERELQPLLPAGVSIALVNGPQLCVVAGDGPAIESLQGVLKSRQVITRPVRNGHAFHSRLLDPIVPELTAQVAAVERRPPQIPFISSVSGDWITGEAATNPAYWADHARSTVRFADALERVWQLPHTVLLEAGPGRTLGVLALQHPARPAAAKPAILSSLGHGYERTPDAEVMLRSAGRLWTQGAELAWEKINPGRRKVSLPTYPFERQRHWWDQSAAQPAAPLPTGPEHWAYRPAWERSEAPVRKSDAAGWLLIGRSCDLLTRLQGRIGGEAVTAWPREGADWIRAAQRAVREGRLNLVYLAEAEAGPFEQFLHLLQGVQALGEAGLKASIRIAVVSREVHDVVGSERLRPASAVLLGLSQVTPLEYPEIQSMAIDLPGEDRPWADRIAAELAAPALDPIVAYRGRHRWVRRLHPLALPPPESGLPLKTGGVYLITGGAGGLGIEIGKFLARTCSARLILTRRGSVGAEPAPGQAEIKAAGGAAEVVSCDVTDRAAMKRLIERIVATYGRIDGAVHAAGILHDGVMALKTPAAVEAVLAPKIHGAEILYELLKPLRPDFLVLFSSLASVAPFHGQSDYCGANAFLDAFGARANAEGLFPVVTFNWPVWRETGIFTRMATPAGLEADHEDVLKGSISTAQGVELFARGLASRAPEIVVTPLPLSALQQRRVPRAGSRAPAAGPGAVTGAAAGAGEEPVGADVEATLTAIWCRVLGVPQVGRNDNFLDLGGHSLLAAQIVTQIRNTYRIGFTLRNFFDAPTIAEAAAAVEEAVLTEIERLSEEPASAPGSP